jgi:hypothetical protein
MATAYQKKNYLFCQITRNEAKNQELTLTAGIGYRHSVVLQTRSVLTWGFGIKKRLGPSQAQSHGDSIAWRVSVLCSNNDQPVWFSRAQSFHPAWHRPSPHGQLVNHPKRRWILRSEPVTNAKVWGRQTACSNCSYETKQVHLGQTVACILPFTPADSRSRLGMSRSSFSLDTGRVLQRWHPIHFSNQH